MNGTEGNNIFSRIDWITVFTYTALVIFGWFNIYSSVYSPENSSIYSISQRYGKQMLWIIIAVIIIIAIFFLESRYISMFSYIVYGLTIFLLISVLILGKEVHGSRSWFVIGSLKFQPAEFAKFATALALAKFMSKDGFKILELKNLTVVGGLIMFPILLIILQGDAGSALIYLSFILVLYREGLPFIFIFLIFLSIILFISSLFFSLALVISVITVSALLFYYISEKNLFHVLLILGIQIFVILLILAYSIFSYTEIPIHYIITTAVFISFIIAFIYVFKNRLSTAALLIFITLGSIFYLYSVEFIYNDILKDHQRTRINILFNLEEDNKGAGYNMNQSLIAIGSGGYSGKGFLKGTQTKGDFVPEQDTDFIYCTVGEEWGFLGSAGVVLAFTFLLLRIIRLAERQNSNFSRIYGYSVAVILFFHYAVNIAMTIKLAPVIGIPLPFFSYGGSSLWAFTILLFTFIKLDSDRHLTI